MSEFAGKTVEIDFTEQPIIDLKDRKIISVLGTNCRLSATHIGKVVGLSKEVVYYRVKNLEKKKIIRENIAVLNPSKLGFHMFIVYVQTQNLSEQKEEQLINMLIKNPATHYVLHALGKFDIVFDVLAQSIQEFDLILRKILNEFGIYVKHYEVSPIIDVLKYVHLPESFSKELHSKPAHNRNDSTFIKYFQNTKIDYSASQANMDKKDLQILYILSSNATIQLKYLGDKIGLSPDSIKYRIKKLIERNIILGFLPVINLSLLVYHNYGILIELNNISFEEKNKLFRHLSIHPDVSFCLKTGAQYEITLNISVRSNLHLHNFINELKQNYSNQIKTLEMFLIIKDYKIAFFPKAYENKK